MLRRRTVVTAGTAALLAAGCVPRQELEAPPDRHNVVGTGEPTLGVREGGDLVMALSSEPDRLDPTTSSSLYTRYVMQPMCEKLYDIDSDGEIVPMLATELPTIEEGGLTLTFPLRSDAVFSDGEPFNAAAVAAMLTRHLTHEASSRKSELGPVDTVEAVDEHTVKVTFSAPFSPFTAALADRAGMILSPKAVEEMGDDVGNHPVGVGAFRFVRRVPQTSIELERDPLYYDADNVHLDRITYRIMTDANIRAANVQSGDVHVADSISPQDIEVLEAARGVTTLQVGSLGYQALTINLRDTDPDGNPIDPPLIATDPRVRQALSIALDREALTNTVFNGWYTPAGSPIAPGTPFSTPESDHLPAYDPAAARTLLAAAGAPIPYPLQVKVSNSQDALRYAQAMQAQLSQAGFALSLLPTEYTAILDAQDRGDFEAVQLGWSGRADPHGNAYNFWTTDASNNYSGYSSPEMDDLLARAAEQTSIDDRAATYGEAVALMQEVNAVIYLYRLRSLTALSSDVTGVATFADGVVRLSHAAFLDEKEN